ncbi:MAG: 5-(carboxyamino)imidazole ribonucleotide synthase [Flavobacteriales bacterium]
MKNFYAHDFKLGILGGGQLGRMFIQEAINYDVRTCVLDPAADAPCSTCAHEFVQGSFNDYETVVAYGQNKDVLTIEIEHVNLEALETLQMQGKKIFPSPQVLRMVKDKGLQKQFYLQHNIATAPFHIVNSRSEIVQYIQEFPYMQKLRTGGYDGKGVKPLRKAEDIDTAFDEPSVLEKMVDFEKEISVIIARNEQGDVRTFPLVEMEFSPEANLVEFLFSPAEVSSDIEMQAVMLARQIVAQLDFVGLLAIEMFVDKQGNVLVNEMAPRPHNSGHHTIEACETSQYEQHMRSILNLPLGETTQLRAAVMVNLLGEKGQSGPVKYEGLEEVMSWPGVHVHLYGKSETRPFRKMGHVTCTNESLSAAKQLARRVMNTVKVVSEG